MKGREEERERNGERNGESKRQAGTVISEAGKASSQPSKTSKDQDPFFFPGRGRSFVRGLAALDESKK